MNQRPQQTATVTSLNGIPPGPTQHLREVDGEDLAIPLLTVRTISSVVNARWGGAECANSLLDPVVRASLSAIARPAF